MMFLKALSNPYLQTLSGAMLFRGQLLFIILVIKFQAKKHLELWNILKKEYRKLLLKFNKLRAMLSLLPSVERLDAVASRVVLIGFILLTIGLAAGGRLPRPEGVAYFKDSKVIWSALLWVIYAGLLFGHMRSVFTGRRFAYGLIGTFVFLVLTFWGTNLLSTLHQQP
jgi:ABC-type uncharacterized transport system permease subunit